MGSGGATLTGTLAASIILLAGLMSAGGGTLTGLMTAEILLAAIMLTGGATLTGNLMVARHVGRLANCGDPLSTACQEGWMPGA
jgi:hypothetical protein